MKQIDMNKAKELCRQGETASPEERKVLQTQRLNELVAYAREHSTYFKELYKDLGEKVTLAMLPPTDKADLMKDYESWVTDPEITYEGVFAYLGSSAAIGERYLGKYTALSTSGTTGNPTPMVRDAYHNTIHGILMEQRLMRDTDKDLVLPVNNKVATALFPHPHVSSYAAYLRMQKQFPDHLDNLLAVSLLDDVNHIADRLNDFQPDFFTGYPSVMGALANAQRQGRMNIHPKGIACSAEVLTERVYHALRETFDCPVLNNYCSTEGGEAAMSCACGKLHINEDWILIEPVMADGTPTPEGELSDGIYITDLTNYVQPIIRYYMGDKIRIQKEPCACGSSLPVMDIIGRVVDPLMVGDQEVLAVNIDYLFMNLEGVYSFQLVQKGPVNFEIRMILEEEEKREEIFQKAKGMLDEFFKTSGCPPTAIVSSLESPIHSEKGGKVKYVAKDFDRNQR